MNALELHALSKAYGASNAIEKLSLTVAAGSRTAIVGPSGSGKTTLLRLIAGFEHPDAGRITQHGAIVYDRDRLVPAWQRNIGFVPQDGALFPHLSVTDNIGFGLDIGKTARAHRIGELMERVELNRELGARMPHELSGGQQQRVALARALSRQPGLMLLDEPFSALDTGLRASLRKTVTRLLADAGISCILVTHDQSEALSFADQLAVLRRGRLIQAGSPMALYHQPRDEETARFLGDALILPAHIAHSHAECALGRIPVRAGTPQGQARIMLRPEQIRLSGVDRSTTGCRGQIRERDFCGHDTLLTIELPHTTLQVKYPNPHAPDINSFVRVSAEGCAHVLNG